MKEKLRDLFILTKKEVKELLTPQMILPIIMISLVFSYIGNTVKEEREDAPNNQKIIVVDNDGTEKSQYIIDTLEELNYKLETESNQTEDEALKNLKDSDLTTMIIIPEGFGKKLNSSERPYIQGYSEIPGFSMVSTGKQPNVGVIYGQINEAVSNLILLSENVNPTVKTPIDLKETVVHGDKSAEGSMYMVMQYIASQIAFIPIVLFLIVTLASQLVATAIATEKENKTLEILLSSPVDRKMIVASKLLGAGTVALFMAVAYMLGMRNYMSGLAGDAVTADSLGGTIEALGLNFTNTDFLMLGSVLFLGILTALAIALILGSFAEDSKGAQSTMAPVMMMLLIPYLITLILDMESLPKALQYVVYAIPFTHTFTATTNILMDNYTALLYGGLYVLVVFIGSILLASHLFSSEKIFMLKLGKRKKNG